MKKLFLLFFAIVSLGFVATTDAQIATIQETKESNLKQLDLYSRTKRFIGSVWNVPSNVIQNDDKEGGTILVRSRIVKVHKQILGFACTYEYWFDTEFRMKDGKYRIEIKNLSCTKAEQSGMGETYEIPFIQPFEGDNAPEKTKSLGKGISKKKAIEMMKEIKLELYSIVASYIKTMEEADDF